ncbi:MAG: helix-hairpin-helix domain-containing protein [Anaerolineales bacterium]|nr:helix-hairpin-helix domain-containing protein [Anaerolineales bacterium]
MSRLLDFLNSADAETLTQKLTVSRELAEKIVAARPFETEDDALKVEGASAETLERWRESAPQDAAIVAVKKAVKKEAPPAVEEEKPSASQDSFLHRLGLALRAFGLALLKLIQLAALIGTIALALYYGVPYLRENFIAPVERNAARIETLSELLATQAAANDANAAQVEGLRTQVAELNVRAATLDETLKSQTTAQAKLEAAQATLDAQMQSANNAALAELRDEVAFARALDTLGRARLYLAQSNFGLAKEDLQSARDALAALDAQKPDAALTQALTRLDLALGNLPDFPVVASGDLEIAWQILMTGEAPAPTPTATPAPTETPSATATP